MSDEQPEQPEQPGAQPTPPPYPGGEVPPPPTYPAYPDPAQPQYGQPQYGQPQYGQPQYGQPQYGQPQYGQPYPQPGYGWAPPGPDLSKRPGNVTAASVITWVVTTLNVLGLFVLLALGVADNDDFFGELTSDVDDVSRADIRLGLIIGCIVLLVWAAVAVTISVFAFRGKNWARITLVISAVISVPFQLLGVAAVLPGLGAVATVVAIVLFFTGNANAWYRQQREGGLPPMPPGATSYS